MMRCACLLAFGLAAVLHAVDDVGTWCQNQSRTTVLETVCDHRSDQFILDHHTGFIALLADGARGIPVAPLRRYVAWLLYVKADLNYEQAAVVLKAMHEIDGVYDTDMAQSAVAAYVALFPRAVADATIITTAKGAGWDPGEAAWNGAFWVADLERSEAAGNRRTIRGPIALMKPAVERRP